MQAGAVSVNGERVADVGHALPGLVAGTKLRVGKRQHYELVD